MKYKITINSDAYVEIISDNLRFVYFESNKMSGCQVENMYNQKRIYDKCLQIRALISEIDKLNKL